MIDSVLIRVISGKGGSGIVSGRREKFAAYGGPDGGDGGNGGAVIARADRGLNDLLGINHKKVFRANPGGEGRSGNRKGSQGRDSEILVPLGTEIWIVGKEREKIGELSQQGQQMVLAKGGKGGRGNARFTSSTNQYPLLAEAGEKGKDLHIGLELKLLADVGIVGAPNAGKSTLLAALTAARPKVAAYPFTTIDPVLGVFSNDEKSFVLVDIPGIIEGAHLGTGLGHDFLRHIERTKIIIHLIDGSTNDPKGDYAKVRKEMAHYQEEMTEKKEVVVINKIDVGLPNGIDTALREVLDSQTDEIFYISAIEKTGLAEMVARVINILEHDRANDTRRTSAVPTLRPTPVDENLVILGADGIYDVTLISANRLAETVDPDNWGAKIQLFGRLRQLGVITALERAGIEPGQRFRVGAIEWEWE